MLSGIRVIEFEGLGPAPFAAMHLADLGADVIVIHRKTTSAVTSERSLLDRGKRSIALDLKNFQDLQIARALCAQADALIEGYRPGVMERLGLGPADLHARNPKLVYGRMTGWGQTGPIAHQAGHDLNYIATSGALWYASAPDETPMTPATLVGDIGGGANYLVIGILAGLLSAQRTGQGTVVDAAIVDGSAHMMNLLMAIRQAGGFSEARGQSLLDGPHWSRVYLCEDGRHISVQCLEPKFYAEFLSLLDLQAHPLLQEQDDARQWPQQVELLARHFSQHPAAHWEDLFQGSDACVAVVMSPQQAASHPHMQARETWRSPNGVLQAAPAPRFSSGENKIGDAPARDQHRQEILNEISGQIS